jgi:hypothetical protein
MRLVNDTHWHTDQLRALINRVADDELSPRQRKILRVHVVYGRCHQWKLGHAFIGTLYSQVLSMKLFLPREQTNMDRSKLAHVIAHEMAHCSGLRHPDMKSNRYAWVDGWRERYAYALDLPMELVAPVVQSKPGDEMKYAHATKMAFKWSHTIKLATARLKKWHAKARYYEKKIAAKNNEAKS